MSKVPLYRPLGCPGFPGRGLPYLAKGPLKHNPLKSQMYFESETIFGFHESGKRNTTDTSRENNTFEMKC